MQANEALNRALTGMREHSMKAAPVNIEAAEKQFRFRTHNDPMLRMMLEETLKFYSEIRADKPARWLSFIGVSGTGKTHLCKRLYNIVSKTRQFQTTVEGNEFSYPDDFILWPQLAGELQTGENPADYYHAPRTKFLAIDDIGAIRDSTGHITSKLVQLLCQRDNRWTVITSNMTIEAIEKKIDGRVASRLIRGNNVLVEVNCIDYALRKNK